MGYKSIVAVRPNQTTYHVSYAEASKLVADGHATWGDKQNRSVNVQENGALRGLSCRVGPELANAYFEGQDWAQVAVAHIRKQIGPIR